ncbi:hypothetical protein [Paraglaciecola chathamensis]|uniref:hypothetical protein n=1 Tax=Paraglaciecola chathamensis TaxID=368405 RepID=UPI00270796EB|nr:hypothetical protein [Paraglaciecola chathamensis]MDO6561699.1 hypothetical protein [Paraglaciecola chathamensis]
MKTQLLLASTTLILCLSGCANKQKPCEDILEVKRQEQQCNEWRKTMKSKQHPQQALTAKKRFEEACVDLRYYRDGYDTICKGTDKPIGERKDQP